MMKRQNVEIPTEWLTSEPIAFSPPTYVKLEHAGQALHGCVCFSDGQVVFFLACPEPEGVRFARISPDTNWATEERYTGEPPHADDRGAVDEAWRGILAAVTRGKHKARAEMGET